MSDLAALPEPARTRLAGLLSFAEGAVLPEGGFGWLDVRGRPTPGADRETWIAARMTYVFALGARLGVAGAAADAEHGVRALAGLHRDPVHGGWYAAVAPDRPEPTDPAKQAYAHAFVALAAGAATAAGIPGARALLDDAVATLDAHFVDEAGRVVESWDRAFTTAEDYRGANASMHLVEALLVVGDVLDDPQRHRTALGIAEHLIHDVARRHDHLLPEHFTAGWEPALDYSRDRPADPFRPYGATPGHLLEWARLLLHLEAALPDAPGWLLDDARRLFDTAVRVGWQVDGAPGFVYTVDWDARPVVHTRMHWVVAEAIAAAGALHRRTGEAAYERWAATWWAYAEAHLVDAERGSWHHELDADNRPAATVWRGKPDVYHAVGAVLLPLLPLAPSAPVALGERRGPATGW